MVKTPKIFSWFAAIIGASIMLQTLYYKFTAASESVFIFTTIGLEPWGRIGIGIAELIASALLIIPTTRWFGSLMSIGLMSGAIFFHLTILGIEVKGDQGQLFYYALVVIIVAMVTLYIDRLKLFSLMNRLLKK